MTKEKEDFREAFARMASEAVMSRHELALLLATTPGAVTQMAYRGELPATAFPEKRRACWFVGDIRGWLNEMASKRVSLVSASLDERADARAGARPRSGARGDVSIGTTPKSDPRAGARMGRPRLPINR